MSISKETEGITDNADINAARNILPSGFPHDNTPGWNTRSLVKPETTHIINKKSEVVSVYTVDYSSTICVSRVLVLGVGYRP